MRKSSAAVVPLIHEFCPERYVIGLVSHFLTSEHRLHEGRNAVRRERCPTHSSTIEEHIAALIRGGHVHHGTPTDLSDKLKVGVETRGPRAAASDAIATPSEEGLVNGESGELDIGLFGIRAFHLRFCGANVFEGLLPASLILGDEFLAENKILSSQPEAVIPAPRQVKR